MKRLMLSFLALVLVIATLSACKPASATLPPAPQYPVWQYATVIIICQVDSKNATLVCHKPEEKDLTTMENTLNAMGSQGWEMVSASRTSQEAGDLFILFFKRK